MSRVLILAGATEFVARVNVMPGTQVVTLSRETVEHEKFDLMRSLDPQSLPDVIFIGESLSFDRSLQIARSTDETYPSVDVFLVADVSLDVVVEAMRGGFRDVLATGETDERIREVLRRAEINRVRVEGAGPGAPSSAPPAPATSRTITIVSPKGGVGKTSIATNLAIGLAATHPSEVVLVDLDLQFGDVAATLDLRPTHTIDEALSPSAASDNLVVKTMLTVHPAGFHVLCGSESPAATEDVTGPQIVRLLTQLATQFKYVLVDTAGGLSEPTLAALEVTDDIVIVSTMDVACVRGVRKAVELLNQIGLMPSSRVLALNMASNQSGMKVKDVEAAVGLPVDVVIARAHEVQLAANHGVPLMLGKKKNAPFVKAIRALIKRLDSIGTPGQRTHKRLEVA